ncbi:MAG: hypothetical protein ACOCU9_02935, partial [Spirochaetota bacterium]
GTMRFTLTISATGSSSASRNPRSLAAETLEEHELSYRTIGPVIEVDGSWETVMESLHEAYALVRRDYPSVIFSMTAHDVRSAPAGAAESMEVADVDSFPASDPPGTSPGPS